MGIDKHDAQSTSKGPKHWPDDVKPISIGGLDSLGVDSNGNLYWDGKLIETKKKLDLNWWQIIIAILTALGAFSSGLVAFLEYLGIYPC